ncbi:ShlB/FhaC/HecB family hemolysin secretion/activation protein [Candidatus Entotheonella palauensis]|uniref:ShlB/FhaC/HecB family hemolysin secretion/activation protein n=1 Tax=Candidatus Entotheonella palauensis TaxID=93172 RepID=UPI0015C457A2|nr:ShlB/FhaC/HecB family hemolysin secretion/activation protein [Candidatus Entotheonella palauensis]
MTRRLRISGHKTIAAKQQRRHRSGTLLALFGVFVLAIVTQHHALGQTPPTPSPSQPQSSEPRWVLPPLPPLSPEQQRRLPGPRVFVNRIVVTGSTAFSNDRIDAVTDPYINREVTSEELESLRLALTQLYVQAGYINSGAVLMDQDVRDGTIRFHIIEGELTDVVVTENKRFRTNYLRNRLALDVTKPLHIGTLQKRLQRLQQDGRIRRLQAELRPGIRRGESELHVRVEETLPYTLSAAFNNYQAASIGSERGQLTVGHRNLTGRGDILSVTASKSEGSDLQLDASYILPLNARDTTLGLRYRRNVSTVIEEPFEPLDIDSLSEIFSVTLRAPLYRTLQREFAMSMSGERLHSETTFISGIGFPVLGADDGETTITALRFTAEWVDRTSNQVLALRSRFSFGLDALGATINPKRPDNPGTIGNESAIPPGRFAAWLGQFQLGRRLNTRQIELLFRFDIQLTTEPLLALEQIAVGGRFSVRGYRENQLVRDNGALVSLESRVPLIRNRRWAEYLQVVPFVDAGWGWQTRGDTPSPKNLTSVGLGLRWAARWMPRWAFSVPLQSEFEIFWGYQLRDVTTNGGNLQDHGLHLQLAMNLF